MPNREQLDDDRGFIDKISSGDVTAIDRTDLLAGTKTALDLAGYAEKFVPAVGTLVGNSTPIGAGLNLASAYYENEKERQKVAKYFDVSNVRQLIRQNPALKRKLEKEVDWWDFAGQMAASMGGAAVGGSVAALLSFVFPVLMLPVLSAVVLIAGTFAGGYIGNSLYKAAFEKQEQDPIVINMQITKMHNAGEYVAPEIVFAALAANLPEKYAQNADNLLNKYTGTKLFTEALSDHNNIPKLRAMMNNAAIDSAIRAQIGMPHDPQDPYKSVAEQYADMINSGQMKPQNLLNSGEGMYVMAAMMRQREQGVDVPVTPESRQNYVGITS